MMTNEERVTRIKRMLIPTAVLSVIGLLFILELAFGVEYPEVLENIMIPVSIAGDIALYVYCWVFGNLIKIIIFPFKYLWFWGPFSFLFILMVVFPIVLLAVIFGGWFLPWVVMGYSYLRARSAA